MTSYATHQCDTHQCDTDNQLKKIVVFDANHPNTTHNELSLNLINFSGMTKA